MPLSKKDRAIDTQRARRLAGAFIQLASRILQIPGHRAGIAHKKMPALCRDYRPRVAVEKLLPEGVLKLVDHAGNLRRGDPFPPRNHGEILRFINVDEDQQRANADMSDIHH